MDAHTFTKKAKQTLSARKLRETVFWDRKGVLMVEFMQQGTTITSQVYCETPKKLCCVIQNKRRGMLTYGVELLHVNASAYSCSHSITAAAFQLGIV
jgi:hypothetical protein